MVMYEGVQVTDCFPLTLRSSAFSFFLFLHFDVSISSGVSDSAAVDLRVVTSVGFVGRRAGALLISGSFAGCRLTGFGRWGLGGRGGFVAAVTSFVVAVAGSLDRGSDGSGCDAVVEGEFTSRSAGGRGMRFSFGGRSLKSPCEFRIRSS